MKSLEFHALLVFIRWETTETHENIYWWMRAFTLSLNLKHRIQNALRMNHIFQNAHKNCDDSLFYMNKLCMEIGKIIVHSGLVFGSLSYIWNLILRLLCYFPLINTKRWSFDDFSLFDFVYCTIFIWRLNNIYFRKYIFLSLHIVEHDKACRWFMVKVKVIWEKQYNSDCWGRFNKKVNT